MARKAQQLAGIDRSAGESVFTLDALALAIRGGLNRVTPWLARIAVPIVDRRSWTLFGYARSDDYARERLRRSGRWLRDLATLGKAIGESPRLELAINGDDGGQPLGRVAATIVARAAVDETMDEWIDAARELRVRELRDRAREDRARGAPERKEPSSVASQSAPVSASEVATEEPERRLRIPLPAAMRAGFDEALALSRSLAGREATVTEFVASLVAECLAGSDPPDIDSSPVLAGPRRVDIEALLASATQDWRRLSEGDEARSHEALQLQTPEVLQARLVLERLHRISRNVGSGEPPELDRQLREVIEVEDELQRCLGRILEALRTHGAWATLMFHGVGHYAEQRLGVCRRTAEERAQLARVTRRLPVIGAAYDDGRIGSEAALLVARVVELAGAEPELQAEWVERAEQYSIKRLRDEVRAIGRSRWTAEELSDGRPLDDQQWQRSLEQSPGTIRDRVSRLALEAARLPQADVFLSLRLPADVADDFLRSLEWRRSSIERDVTAVPWDRPWPDEHAPLSVLVGRLFSVRARRVPTWVGLLGLLEDFVTTWDANPAALRRRGDKIYSRDGWRCTAPGCTSRRNLEDHHVQYRSQGGGNDLENRIAICRFHHQLGEHGSLASCRGTAPLRIIWRLGRADVAEWFQNERRIQQRSA